MKQYHKTPEKEKQKSHTFFFLIEILTETALVLFSRLKSRSELHSCSPMQPKEDQLNEIPDSK